MVPGSMTKELICGKTRHLLSVVSVNSCDDRTLLLTVVPILKSSFYSACSSAFCLN